MRRALALLAWLLCAGCHDFDALSSQYVPSADLHVGLDLGPTLGDLATSPDLATASCTDGRRDGNESDIDCGGTCARCVLGQRCSDNQDCVGNTCTAGRCAPGAGLTLGFNVPASFATGVRGDQVLAGDFNHDGKLDLAVLNTDGPEVFVLLNNGASGFAVGVPYRAGTAPTAIARGDLDNDGHLDLLVLSPSTAQLGVLRGNGDGTFAALAPVAAVAANAAAVVDFNADGVNDLALAISASAGVSVMLGAGGGAFGPPTAYPTGGGPDSLASADFDGDGYPDLAVANGVDRTISVLLNTTAMPGTFRQAANSVALADVPGELVAGNLDAESKPDLAISGGGKLYVMANGGTGLFGAPAPVSLSSFVVGFALGDMDADGKLDIVYTANTGLVGILPGNGNVTFRPPIEYAADGLSAIPVVADFSGDSRLDVAVGFRNGASMKGGANLLVQAADGALHAAVAYDLGKETIWGAAGDFNADGKIDLAIVDHGGSTAGALSVAFGGAVGALGAPMMLNAGAKPAGVAVADVDGNGTLDLAVGSEGQNATPGAVTLFTGMGNGSFVYRASFATGNNSRFVAFADVNHDGKPDLLVAVTGVPGAADAGAVKVLLGDGKGGFNESASLTSGQNPRTLAVGDFNHDDQLDLAAANTGSNDVGVLFGHGDGTFGAASAFPTTLTTAFGVAAADFNGDGELDLAVSGQGSNNIAVLLGSASGAFQPAVTFAAPGAPRELAVADFNLDGVPDLVVAGNLGGIGVLLGNGLGALQPLVSFAAGATQYAPVVADLNADGRPDIAMIGARTTVILNTSH